MTRQQFLGILLAAVLCTAVQPGHAATIAVTTTVDEINADGDCSLREAVRAANTNLAVDDCDPGEGAQTDTITVPAGTYTLTLVGNDNDAAVGDLDLRDNAAVDDLVISGAGAATTIIQACAVEQLLGDCPAGQGVADRVLHVFDLHVAISGVTIRHGRAPIQNGARTGNGIWIQRLNTPAALTLTDVVVTKNGAATDRVEGAGIANWLGVLTLTRVIISDNQGSWGGGIHNTFSDASGTATLVMSDSTVSGNTAGSGGGILNEAAAVATLTNSIISDNYADTGGGGGVFNFAATATFTGCTVSGNRAAGSGGGGVLRGGGGILNYSNAVTDFTGTVVTLTNSTLSGNGADDGAGGGFSNDRATATLINCTVSGNQAATFAGGIYNSLGTVTVQSSTVTANRMLGLTRGAGGIYASNPIVLRNTIVAGNFHDATNPDLHSPDCTGYAGSPASEGFSLVGDAFLCPALVDGVNGDQIGTRGAVLDAMLGPLADNGGPTLTHALLSGSPAVDGGNPATPGSGGTACPSTDQRGETRPSGIACDVGAVEGGGGDGGGINVDAVKPTRGGTAGTVKTLVYGSGFVAGATVKLVRPGFPDVVGTATNVKGSVLTTTLDLRGAAPGAWSVVAENPDASSATLGDAFTVEVGGGADLWVDLVLPRSFVRGRTQSIYVAYGNRGTVDAYGVPIWLSFPDELEFHVPFPVSPPPSQPGQVPTDWTRIAIDEPIPPPENRDSFPLLLPVVPAGSTGVLRFRVESPSLLGGSPDFNVTADIGTPYFQPDLAEEVVAGYVARAKEFAAESQATPGVPSDAAIAAYVRTQLAGVSASGQANADLTGYPPVFSQSQLIVDTAYFIAVASAPALALAPARRWFAGLVDDFVDDFVGRSAEARVVNPDCRPGDAFCERDDEAPIPCPFPQLCCPITGILCIEEIKRPKCGELNKIGHEWYFIPCPPERENEKRPLTGSLDPNDKVGPGGPGGFIDGLTPLPYTINFENIATATGEAYEVTVTDQLDVTKYDLTTFGLGPISFGDRIVPVPPGLQSFSTEVDLRPGVNILVGIDAALDTGTGIVAWKFTTLDPATHEFPEDPEFGFLPPNVTSPEGEGAVLFTVSLKPGFGLGTTVCNDASIVFDFNPPIETPTFCNTIGAPEDCENCVDDDGDQLVDRADPDCTAAPNGAGAGVGDATAGKAVDKCAKTIRKVGTKLASTRLKQLGACQKAVADCVHLKPGDAACITKAQGKCTKARTSLAAAETKLSAAIVKACSEPTVTAANLRAGAGLGFDAEASACAGLGVAGVGAVADVAECIRAEHQCGAERILSAAVPRARELLLLGGFDPVSHFRCLDAGANGGGSVIAAEKRKALRKCDATIQKAATKLVAGRVKAGAACGGAVFTCLQTKPEDPACVGKAGGTCAKAVAGIPKLEAAFATAVAKGCGTSPLTAADLLTVDGLGAAALAERCAALGIASLTTVADVTACLEAQLTCHVDHLLESTMPRLGELLDLGGVALP
jgi:CSLREA domain-containing protein